MYIKNCRYCNIRFEANGPAGYQCDSCRKGNKFVRVSKGLYYNKIKDVYNIRMKRQSSGYYAVSNLSKEEALSKLKEFSSTFELEDNTGIHNNAIRGGVISPYINYYHYSREFRKGKAEFTCNRCSKVKPIKKLNIHHIDHNRLNDNEDNFEILCTVCHRVHHNIHGDGGKFIQSSETIPNGSTSQVNGDGSGVHSYE